MPSTSGIKKRLSRHRRKIILHQIVFYKERLKSGKDVWVIGRLLIHFKYQIILYLQTFSSYTVLKPQTKNWEAEAKNLLVFVRQYAEKVEKRSLLLPPVSEWYKIDGATVTFTLQDIDGKSYQYSTSLAMLRNNFVYSKEHYKVIISSEYTVYYLTNYLYLGIFLTQVIFLFSVYTNETQRSCYCGVYGKSPTKTTKLVKEA